MLVIDDWSHLWSWILIELLLLLAVVIISVIYRSCLVIPPVGRQLVAPPPMLRRRYWYPFLFLTAVRYWSSLLLCASSWICSSSMLAVLLTNIFLLISRCCLPLLSWCFTSCWARIVRLLHLPAILSYFYQGSLLAAHWGMGAWSFFASCGLDWHWWFYQSLFLSYFLLRQYSHFPFPRTQLVLSPAACTYG